MIVAALVVGSGKLFFSENVRLDLELFEERCFRKGVVVSAVRRPRLIEHFRNPEPAERERDPYARDKVYRQEMMGHTNIIGKHFEAKALYLSKPREVF